jgi:hypothetical protein
VQQEPGDVEEGFWKMEAEGLLLQQENNKWMGFPLEGRQMKGSELLQQSGPMH